MRILTSFITSLNVQNVHRWLAHMSAVTFTDLSMAFSGKADKIDIYNIHIADSWSL